MAREDLVLGGQVVHLSATGGAYGYIWELLDAPTNAAVTANSAAVLSSSTGSAVTITPDYAGTYYGRVTSGVDVQEWSFYAGPPLSSTAAELPRRIPSFMEGLAHNVPDAIDPLGNRKGWSREWRRWFSVIQAAHNRPISAAWNTILDTNFAAQPNATYASDGNVTIDGRTWVVGQTANAAAGYQLAMVNGRGLRLCRSTGSVDIAGRTSPLVSCKFPVGIGWGTPLRATLSIAHYDAWNNWAGVSLGIDAQTSAVGWRSGYIVNRITSDGQADRMSNAYGAIIRGELALPPHGWALESNSNPSATATPATAYDSIGLLLPNGYGGPATMVALRGLVAAGIFSDFSKMRVLNSVYPTASGYVDAPIDNVTDEAIEWGVTLMGLGTDANQHVYAVRLKVEAFY